MSHSGIGMTSQRTRERLIERIRAQGVRDEKVLSQILNTPRHLFIDDLFIATNSPIKIFTGKTPPIPEV